MRRCGFGISCHCHKMNWVKRSRPASFLVLHLHDEFILYKWQYHLIMPNHLSAINVARVIKRTPLNTHWCFLIETLRGKLWAHYTINEHEISSWHEVTKQLILRSAQNNSSWEVHLVMFSLFLLLRSQPEGSSGWALVQLILTLHWAIATHS